MPNGEDSSREARAELRAAWDRMIAELERARDAIDDPSLMPPPENERMLAEGYRYLMGFMHGGVERAFFEDPARPFFRHALHILNKGTIDNPDAIYFVAPLDGHRSYTLRGQAPAPGRKPPHYLIFELTDGCIAGDSGSLAELRPGLKAQTGWIDSTQLAFEADGSFEILLAPEPPTGFAGNFVATRRETTRPGPDGSNERHACYVSGRQLFQDWENEDPFHLTLTAAEPVDAPPPYGAADAAAQLRRFGELVRGQMHFWNQFYTILLETHGKHPGGLGEKDGPRFMPRNAFNPVNAASGATGGGQATNLYAGGVFELEPDEALLVENEIPVPPQFTGFGLANLWGESLDFACHQSSLNGFQAETDSDGVIRYVVAHRDPGIANWLDTTGHREGFLTPRWSYSEIPDREHWPRIRARKIAFVEIQQALPPSTRRVGDSERREAIRIREAHVRRRYRVF